jgi:hypothetical protein
MNDNVFSIANTSLNTTGPVGLGPGCSRFRVNVKLIIVILATQERSSKAIARFESLGGWNGHASLGKVGFQLVKDG